jgi:hypothetical protein
MGEPFRRSSSRNAYTTTEPVAGWDLVAGIPTNVGESSGRKARRKGVRSMMMSVRGRSTSRLGHPRRGAVTAAFVALVLSVLASAPAGAAPTGFDFANRPLDQLSNSRTWILQGQRLANGACRYQYPSDEVTIPVRGWELRSLGIDMATCRKLMEEGTPEGFDANASADAGAVSITQSAEHTQSKSTVTALAWSNQGAWQRVIYRDVSGVLVNADLTQINWSYNGSSVSSASTTGGWHWNTATRWQLGAHNVTELYGTLNSSYRGQTTATFTNSYFCNPLPTVHTYYWYNRVWGFPNGTSTRSQSSDTVDECLPIHIDIQAAYGQWPG